MGSAGCGGHLSTTTKKTDIGGKDLSGGFASAEMYQQFTDRTGGVGGRAGSQTRICSFGRCRVVRLHYPPIWSSRRESNPDLFVRTEASSCLSRLRKN